MMTDDSSQVKLHFQFKSETPFSSQNLQKDKALKHIETWRKKAFDSESAQKLANLQIFDKNKVQWGKWTWAKVQQELLKTFKTNRIQEG